MSRAAGCPLCEAEGGRTVLRAARWRLVHAAEPGFPGFYRLVWNDHRVELSDLAPAERLECLEVLTAAEQVLREHLAPTKVNLAAFGNVVPHLHWHLIARYDWDSHFPQAFWAAPVRPVDETRVAALQALLPDLEADLARRLQTWVN